MKLAFKTSSVIDQESIGERVDVFKGEIPGQAILFAIPVSYRQQLGNSWGVHLGICG